MNYQDLTVEVTGGPVVADGKSMGRYQVRVLQSPAGEMTPAEAISVEYEERELKRVLDKLDRRLLDRTRMIDLGRTLAALLLPVSDAGAAPGVRELFARSLIALPADTGLRVRLRLPMALSGIPWEYMYVERAGGDGMDGFLALDPRVAIVRHDASAAPVPSVALEGDLKVVVALAAAADLPELDLDGELQYITAALKGLAGVEVVPCVNATLTALQPLLPQAGIFHYAGHGDFLRTPNAPPGTYTGTGVLAFEDGRVEAEQLGINLRGNGVRLVILAACSTGRRDGVSIWSGIAPALIKTGIPAVIGNQFAIADTAAIAFSQRFYEAIAGGLPIERAMTAARLAIYNTDTSAHDWGVPVLYMRAGDGHLFAGATNASARAGAAEAAEAIVRVRVGNVGAGGVVYGAQVRELLRHKLSISVTTRDVAGTVTGFKGDRVEGPLAVDVTAGDVTGTVTGAEFESLGSLLSSVATTAEQAPPLLATGSSTLIADRTKEFTGRQWVFGRINAWLKDPAASPIFLLTGGPGTGKTAIASRLALANTGSPLEGCDALATGFATYMHFCQATLDSTLAPLRFVQALSEALATTVPSFRAALEGRASRLVTMTTGAVTGGEVVGIKAETLRIELRGDNARELFDEAVRLPLSQITGWQGRPVVILVDSLDEALTFSRDRSIPHLLQLVKDFPPFVRFVLTCRTNSDRVFDLVGPRTLDLLADAPSDADDVKDYAERRLSLVPDPPRSTLAGQIATKSRGNFLYAYHVLNEVLARRSSSAASSVSDLPEELDDVYRGFLEHGLASNMDRWNEMYRPLLGAIVIARGDGLTRTHLMGITGLSQEATDDVLRSCREYLVGGGPSGAPLRVYHQSFGEFLQTDETFQVYPGDRHDAIASCFLATYGKAWRKCEDAYALRYTPHHLAHAASAAAPARRDSLIAALVDLTNNAHYQARCADDLPTLHEHFACAVSAAAASDSDAMLPLVVRAARGVVTFRDRFLKGESVVALAQQGDVDAAIARLPLFSGLDRDWHTAASLIIAWLAVDRAPVQAKAMLDTLDAMAADLPLRLLIDRLRARLAGSHTVAVDEGAAESPDVAEAIVRRLSGQAFNIELLASRGMSVAGMASQTELLEARGYAAQMDGPILVNSARVHGAEATASVDAYIDAHAGYNYVEYRNRSLWVLLHAILRHHPDQQWVGDRLERMLIAVLASGGAEFREMAPLVAAALLERATSGTTTILDAAEATARTGIAALQATRRGNDVWSLHRRRLACVMELNVWLRSDAARAAGIWQDIQSLEGAGVLEGFAGFRAPAELRLADSLAASGVGGPGAVTDRLQVALRTAHHIQDYHFCARITARCRTLERWHGTILDDATLIATIQHLVKSPSDPEFAADHEIGESYAHRQGSPSMGTGPADMMPVWNATNANTLERLAEVFQRPVGDFVRLSPTRGITTDIAVGTLITVPDPGLAPLLAVHLSARVVARPSLGVNRARYIRHLLPVASVNATALDSVLGYLLIASDPEDVGVLQSLVAEFGPPVVTNTHGPSGAGIPS